MLEMMVTGEIKTIAAREGSSGKFTGDIEGLYQGYRFGSTTPDVREYVLDASNGSIALCLTQQIVTPLPPRPIEHPFADGRDPFAESPPRGGAPPGHGPHPGGDPSGHDGPSRHGGPPEAPGIEGGKPIFKRVHYMETKLAVDPSRCTGIFAGSSGEIELIAPNYKMAGYLIVNCELGDLRMSFLEAGTRETLNAELSVDGENSTGIYKNARGSLQFALEVLPPFFGRGPYTGTIILDEAAQRA